MRIVAAKRISSFRTIGAGLWVLFLLCSARSVFAAKDYVRVNQVGYEAGAESRAYLLSSGAGIAPNFKVVDSKGMAVFSGMVGSTLGKWGSFSVFPLDFEIREAGVYTITVEAPSAATSPLFRIDSPANLYSQGLVNALNFYRSERDGADFIATSLRTAAGHPPTATRSDRRNRITAMNASLAPQFTVAKNPYFVTPD
jgi:hypothetical protein